MRISDWSSDVCSSDLATAIANNSGAGLAANGTMTLNSSGDIANYGSLYTGSQMVLNAGHTIRNYRNAAMDSDGSITATGDKFVNNSNVNAKGNITITANEFRNEVEGGEIGRASCRERVCQYV